MINLIKLDLSAIKYYRRWLLLIPVCLFITGWVSSIYLVPMGVFLLFSLSLNPFAVEEQGNLNRLYLTLPIKREKIVAGRYVLSFLMVSCGIILGFALMPLANLVSFSKWYPDYKWNLALISFSLLLYSLMNLSMYPLLFKLGYQKGRLWGVYIPLMFFGMTGIFIIELASIFGYHTMIFDALVYASEHPLLVNIILLLLAAALSAVSLLLSMRIYAKREF